MAIGIPVDMAIVQPVLIATTVMTIPFIFMLFAWETVRENEIRIFFHINKIIFIDTYQCDNKYGLKWFKWRNNIREYP